MTQPINQTNEPNQTPNQPPIEQGIESKDNLQNIESVNNKSPETSPEISESKARQLANLKPPFKAGEPSANPNGKPKGLLNFSTRLNMAIDRLAHEYAQQHNKKYKDQIKAGTMKEIDEKDVDIMGDIFAKYVNSARNGDLKTAKDLLDRSYGRAIQKVEVGGIEGNPLAEAKLKSAKAEADAWERAWLNGDEPLEPTNKNASPTTDTGTA